MTKKLRLLLLIPLLMNACSTFRLMESVGLNSSATREVRRSPEEAGAGGTETIAPGQEQAAITDIMVSANRERLQNGRPPLVASSQLLQAAEARAQDMADLGYFDHVHPLRGTAEIERMLRGQYPNGRITELLYLGNCSLEQLPDFAIEAWLADPANQQELLDPNYQIAGAGIQWGEDGWYAVFVMIADA